MHSLTHSYVVHQIDTCSVFNHSCGGMRCSSYLYILVIIFAVLESSPIAHGKLTNDREAMEMVVIEQNRMNSENSIKGDYVQLSEARNTY